MVRVILNDVAIEKLAILQKVIAVPTVKKKRGQKVGGGDGGGDGEGMGGWGGDGRGDSSIYEFGRSEYDQTTLYDVLKELFKKNITCSKN